MSNNDYPESKLAVTPVLHTGLNRRGPPVDGRSIDDHTVFLTRHLFLPVTALQE